ncbi:MAG: 2OG-Fe(II) oxygenase [bacterium]
MSKSSWFDDAATSLAEKSWCHLPGVLPSSMIQGINTWIDQQYDAGNFKPAEIGKGHRQKSADTIRRDQTLWLKDDSEDHSIKELNTFIESLRVALNRELYSGLEAFEGHFSIYAPGSFYKRHLDTFRDDDSRSMTFIMYLNESWRDGDGGELRLELDANRDTLIQPTAGTVVLFDSRQFFHEVMPARSERRSFNGWFKVRALG